METQPLALAISDETHDNVTESLFSEDPLLLEHSNRLLRLAHRIFSNELSSVEPFKNTPIVRWRTSHQIPGAFAIYLLCPANSCREANFFFQELISYSLTPGYPLRILSSQNLTFRPEFPSPQLYFAEIFVHIENEKQLVLLEKHLPSLAEEIRLGTLSLSHSRHLLELKRFSSASKTSYIYERILAFMQRYPRKFEHDIFRDTQRFLVYCREDFRKIRTVKHLARIICAFYQFQKSIEQDVKVYPNRRHLYLKLMQASLYYPFGLKKVLGITLVLNSLREYECFEQRHILKALNRIIPSLRSKKDSFYSHRDEENNLLTVYLEVEKSRGEDLTLEEIKSLRKQLPGELKNSIEYLSPSLFVPRNEEELYRNIVTLSQELRFVTDLPQAIISFQEQRYDVLKFNVILLRLLGKKSAPLTELTRKLPPQVTFISERIAQVGMLRKKYLKEANVFSFEIQSQLFLRKNHSVDLVRARQYVVKILESILGPFRDYNGGFILKQNEQLDSIKKELGEEGKAHEFLLENLFYSLTPSIMQTLISPEIGKQLCSLFLDSLECDIPKSGDVLVRKSETKLALTVVIKGALSTFKDKIGDAIKNMQLDSFRFASSAVEVEGQSYLCYLYLYPSEHEGALFLSTIEGAKAEWRRNDTQTTRIYLPRATQSLDPRIGTDRTSGIVIKMLYDGLMRVGKDGKLENAIAEDVAISSDWKRYTFTLKETFWSNGTLLTAYDFEYAWKKILDPNFNSLYSFLLFPIKNAEDVKRGEKPLHMVGVKALNEKTLFVELEHPAPYFLGLTAHWTYSPLCRDIDQRHPGWAYQSGDTYVCNGPFKLDMWKLNDDLAVIKNPFYWDADTVKLERIQISIVEDDKVALQMFKRGEIDWMGDPISKIPLKALPALIAKNEVQNTHLNGFYWLQINIDRPPFQSSKIRRAFAYAINRRKLIDEVLASDDEPALRFYPNSNLTMPLFKDGDVAKAQELFEEGLKDLNLKKSELGPIVLTHSDYEEQELITHKLGKQWEEAFGIKIKYERLHWNAFFEAVNKQEFTIGGLVWYSRYDDPIYYLDLLIHREHSVNVTQWKNVRYKEMIDRAKHELVPTIRQQLLEAAEQIVGAEMPLIPLFFQKMRYLKNPRLKDVFLSDIGQIEFRAAYMENE